MEQINEQWRPIEGYEGLYEVSNLGRVRSLDRIDRLGRLKPGVILKPGINKGGYLRVYLSKEGKTNGFSVHRLVAQAFIPNPEGLPVINHKDENPSNNLVFLNPDGSFKESNLEWCTYEYNNKYGTRIERVVQTMIRKGIYDPDMCGLDEKERRCLYYQKNRDHILEQKREYQRDYRRRKKQVV